MRNNDDQTPTEYGGNPVDPRRMPDGRLRPRTTQELARDMRREGIQDHFDATSEPRS